MANRTLLCVDPDEGAVSDIRSALDPYGFKVENIANGEQAIEWARTNGPAVIVVSVEPRKVGYAICNKLKRSPDLQKVPLILTSAEETQQTFEQHKKLKSRADEYILKPLSESEILAKVGALVELGDPQPSAGSSDEDILLSADLSEEISIADSDIVEENNPPAADDNPFAEGANPSTGLFARGDMDAMFDQETDAAFAAIQAPPDPVPESSNGVEAQSSPPPPPVWEDDKTHAALGLADLGIFTPESEPSTNQTAMVEDVPAPPPAELQVEAEAEMDVDVPPAPEDVHLAPPLHDAAMEGRLADLNGRIASLEDERKQLLGEIDELKMRLTSQPLSKEKEVLNLREIINRKEKDILDLRDALDAKDRQALDNKDRLREHERARRDLEEKMLAMEKNLMGAQERTAALQHDKEKSIEREKGLKSRLDDAMTEIQKAHDEVDGLKKRLSQTEDRARADLDRLRGEMQARIAELEEHHRTEAARLSDERVEAEEELKSEYDAELARLKSAHAAELEALQKRSTEEQNAQTERAANELARLRKDHEKALAAAKEEQAVQLAAERQAHQAAIDAKERDHRNEILGLRRRQEEELRAAEERRQKEAADAEARRISDLEAAETRRRQEMQARDEEHHNQLAEMDRRHFDEKTETAERHRQELDQAHARAARSEGELAARTEELSETHRRLAGVQADLDTVRADLRDREVRLGQARDRVAELEAKAAEYEDQILRAFQKLRADDKIVDRAKRALAVALSLLDERASVPSPAAASPSGPTPTATARPQGEESAT